MQRKRAREGQAGGRALCNSWEIYWFGKTSPLITGQNQPAAADTVAGNSKNPAFSHLPSRSLSHLPPTSLSHLTILVLLSGNATQTRWGLNLQTGSWCTLVWCGHFRERLQSICAVKTVPRASHVLVLYQKAPPHPSRPQPTSKRAPHSSAKPRGGEPPSLLVILLTLLKAGLPPLAFVLPSPHHHPGLLRLISSSRFFCPDGPVSCQQRCWVST